MAKYSKASQKKVHDAMHEMKSGKLRSGRSGQKVTDPKQAIAIGLSEAREKGAKVPSAPKKKIAKKAAPKKAAPKKAAPKKAVPKKAAGKKAAPKKAVAKKAVIKKAAPKKAAAKKSGKK